MQITFESFIKSP